ncbi:hypothetical protein [Bradyrhizobium sacchari]|uniref:Novel STAND NTPase 1 domain-containing protein n=1 Tax=Bradyrhizobium sacchari TaxID=1399419 RepID=A0A560JD23_9BRAD|nr:hypothetical protein [Bradyrhizobium sacchari]TWB50887.1 hypothetical protein FBZ94_111219 [Bradyrhizobium sacchari]TWB68905.1 hypothetical protein FBZ95_11025 [Bradyrhizobium sacchari]
MTSSMEAKFDIFTPKLPASPYPGLRPFYKEEWPIFFGREEMTEDVIELLLRKKLLLVHGTSGNGKSSLIRAGVLPRLEQEHARSEVLWRTCATSPGKDPVGNLARGLAAISSIDAIDFRRSLNRGKVSANEIAKKLHLSRRNRLCVLIDQFEEIFHDGARNERASLLIEFLIGFKEDPPEGLFVLLTMRSDFLGFCSQYVGLADAINDGQYLLPPMKTENLLRAIREPAALFDGRVASRLAERLVVDAKASQDELPLIQHGLSRLWAAASTRVSGAGPLLDLDDYKAAGSLASMISAHADEIADSVTHNDPDAARAVQELFRALSAINSEGYPIRRSQRFGQLIAITGTTEERLSQILDAFRQAGVSFVTPPLPAKLQPDTIVNISHEALIRNWGRISDRSTGWLQREFRDGLIWQALRVQAESFLTNPENLLSEATTEARGTWLQERNEAWAYRYGGMWPDVQSLIDASRAETQKKKQEIIERREQAEKLRAEVERNARVRYYLIVAAFVSVIMIALASFSVLAWREAEGERSRAEFERSVADRERRNAIDASKRTEEQMLKTKAALQQATDVANRASKFQNESARTFIASHGDPQVTLANTLKLLENETDPLKVAFFGQIVSQLSGFAKSADIQSATEALIRSFEQTQDSSSADAIGQAIRGVAFNLSDDQAQREARELLKSISGDIAPRRAKALALIFSAFAPKVSQDTANEMKTFLVGILSSTKDPDLMSSVAAALFTLKWTPSTAESELLVRTVLRSLGSTTDPVQIENIVTILAAIAPTLTPPSAQLALESIKLLAPQAPDVFRPAVLALSARTEQGSSIVTPSSGAPTSAPSPGPATAVPSPGTATVPNPGPTSLLQRIATGRWCGSSRSYSLQLSGNTAIWRDNLGSVDVESVSSSSSNDAQTTTQKSFHPDGKSEEIGTTWSYRSGGADRINVKSSGGKSFSLTRC